MGDLITHPECQALLRAILTDPASDAARLVYADWLEESGETARAEFIRVQVELARMPLTRPLIRLVDAEFRWSDQGPSANPLIDLYFEPAPTRGIVGYTDPANLRHFSEPVLLPSLGTLASQTKLVDVEVPLNAGPKVFACHFVRAIPDDRLAPPPERLVRVEFVQLPRFNPETQAIEYPPPCPHGARRRHLESRSRELQAMPLDGWRKHCYPLVGGLERPAWFWTCQRGFVSSIDLTAADFLAHATTLFSAQPITEVRLTDRRPDHVERDPGFDSWTWHNDESRPGPHTLSRDLWMFVERGWFPTDHAAHAALSRACVAYGREQAGLPPLSEETKR